MGHAGTRRLLHLYGQLAMWVGGPRLPMPARRLYPMYHTHLCPSIGTLTPYSRIRSRSTAGTGHGRGEG